MYVYIPPDYDWKFSLTYLNEQNKQIKCLFISFSIPFLQVDQYYQENLSNPEVLFLPSHPDMYKKMWFLGNCVLRF